MKILDLNLSEAFINLGVKPSKFFAIVKKQQIRQEIIDKYGELSDDGYYELTKDCGGKLDFDEVYEDVDTVITAAHHFYHHYDDKKYLLTYDEVLEFLDDKDILINIKSKYVITKDNEKTKKFSWSIVTKNDTSILSNKQYTEREEAMEAVLIHILDRFYNIKL